MSNYSQFIGGGTGTSGFSGYSGASGYSGSAGTSGFSGFSGQTGSTTLTNTYIGFGNASNQITGSANLTWNGSALTVGSTTATIIGNVGEYNTFTIQPNDATSGNYPAVITIKGGRSNASSAPGGALNIQGGPGPSSLSGAGGPVNITGGAASTAVNGGDGGSVSITGGTGAANAGRVGGDVIITGGVGVGTGGAIVFRTPNPSVVTERARFTPAGALSFGSTGTAYGTAGQVLTSNGDAPPSWQTASGGSSGVSGFSGTSGYSGSGGSGFSGISGFSGFSGANAGLPALFAARATSTGQTFNGNTTVDLSTLVFEDVSGMVNLTTNRVIVPTGCDRAIFNITARPVSQTSNMEYFTTIYRNGSAISSSNRATRTFNGMTESTGTLSVSAGDYFTVDINTAQSATTHVVEVSLLCWNSQSATVSGYSGISGFSGISGYSGATPDLSSYVTLTGTQTLTNKTYTGVRETKVAMAANDVDLSLGNYYTKTATTTTTFTASNVPASGTTGSFVLELTNGGSQTINWFTGTTWASGVAPTLTAAGVDVLGFYTFDGGTTWRGLTLALDIK